MWREQPAQAGKCAFPLDEEGQRFPSLVSELGTKGEDGSTLPSPRPPSRLLSRKGHDPHPQTRSASSVWALLTPLLFLCINPIRGLPSPSQLGGGVLGDKTNKQN